MIKKIALDVDGVLLNFEKAYHDLAVEIMGDKINFNPYHYQLHEFLGLTKEENEVIWSEFNARKLVRNFELLPGVEQGIKNIVDAGFEIYIVSAIDPIDTDDRTYNLQQLGIHAKEVHCVGGNHSSKHHHIAQIDPHVFIDDRIDHLQRSLHVPHLVWIDRNQIQYPISEDQPHATTPSLLEWTEKFMEDAVRNIERKYKKKL